MNTVAEGARHLPLHHLTGPEHHLWLKNTPTLYGVDNLAIAPGYTGLNNEQSPTDGTNA